MIIRTKVISQWSQERFNESLQKHIMIMQDEKLEVEIQFSAIFMEERDETEYNALLIGRGKKLTER